MDKNIFVPKLFGTNIFLESFPPFFTRIVLGHQFFWTQTFLRKKTFVLPNSFFNPACFYQNFYQQNFLDQILLFPIFIKSFFYDRNFWTKIFLDKNSSGPKLFGTKIFWKKIANLFIYQFID